MTGSSEQLLPQRAQYVANGIVVGVVSVNPDGGAAGVGHIAFHDDPAPDQPAPDRPGTADA